MDDIVAYDDIIGAFHDTHGRVAAAPVGDLEPFEDRVVIADGNRTGLCPEHVDLRSCAGAAGVAAIGRGGQDHIMGGVGSRAVNGHSAV